MPQPGSVKIYHGISSQREADNLLLGWRVAVALQDENVGVDNDNRSKSAMTKRQYAKVKERAIEAQRAGSRKAA